MFTYALEEELITTNPVVSVKLQQDKRSVHEKKCTPFPPKEMQRLLDAMNEFWGKPMRGLAARIATLKPLLTFKKTRKEGSR